MVSNRFRRGIQWYRSPLGKGHLEGNVARCCGRRGREIADAFCTKSLTHGDRDSLCFDCIDFTILTMMSMGAARPLWFLFDPLHYLQGDLGRPQLGRSTSERRERTTPIVLLCSICRCEAIGKSSTWLSDVEARDRGICRSAKGRVIVTCPDSGEWSDFDGKVGLESKETEDSQLVRS